MRYDVMIIGAGPGGIFSAYELAEKHPELKIAVFETGHTLEKRKCPIDGDKVMLTIPSGTQVGTVLRIPGKGLPRMNSSSRGDMMVRVFVDVPKKVSDEEKELLQKLDSAAGKGAKKGRKKLF